MTIGVATFGDHEWVRLAHQRAIPSALQQGVEVIHRHAGTLAEARNAVLADVTSEYLIYLDADDELDPGYVEAMKKGTADLRVPRLRQVRRRRVKEPFMPQVWGHRHACTGECLRFGNWIVIGACVRAQLLRDVGGWEEWGWSEDWAMWARCWTAGGTVEALPDAIYRAHVSPGSRNHCLSAEETAMWHRKIETAIWPEAA